jgi:hypothetical protein
MSILSCQEAREAGGADPEKTRAERQQELLSLLETASGKGVIEHCFGKYTGVSARDCPRPAYSWFRHFWTKNIRRGSRTVRHCV